MYQGSSTKYEQQNLVFIWAPSIMYPTAFKAFLPHLLVYAHMYTANNIQCLI